MQIICLCKIAQFLLIAISLSIEYVYSFCSIDEIASAAKAARIEQNTFLHPVCGWLHIHSGVAANRRFYGDDCASFDDLFRILFPSSGGEFSHFANHSNKFYYFLERTQKFLLTDSNSGQNALCTNTDIAAKIRQLFSGQKYLSKAKFFAILLFQSFLSENNSQTPFWFEVALPSIVEESALDRLSFDGYINAVFKNQMTQRVSCVKLSKMAPELAIEVCRILQFFMKKSQCLHESSHLKDNLWRQIFSSRCLLLQTYVVKAFNGDELAEYLEILRVLFDISCINLDVKESLGIIENLSLVQNSMNKFFYSQINPAYSGITVRSKINIASKFHHITFSNCVETALLHFFNCILYDSSTGNMSTVHLPNIKGEHRKTMENEGLFNFYHDRKKVFQITESVHHDWAAIVSNLQADTNNTILYAQKLCNYRFELHSGLKNFLNAASCLAGLPAFFDWSSFQFQGTIELQSDLISNLERKFVAFLKCLVFDTSLKVCVEFQQLRSMPIYWENSTGFELFGIVAIKLIHLKAPKSTLEFVLNINPTHLAVEVKLPNLRSTFEIEQSNIVLQRNATALLYNCFCSVAFKSEDEILGDLHVKALSPFDLRSFFYASFPLSTVFSKAKMMDCLVFFKFQNGENQKSAQEYIQKLYERLKNSIDENFLVHGSTTRKLFSSSFHLAEGALSWKCCTDLSKNFEFLKESLANSHFYSYCIFFESLTRCFTKCSFCIVKNFSAVQSWTLDSIGVILTKFCSNISFKKQRFERIFSMLKYLGINISNKNTLIVSKLSKALIEHPENMACITLFKEILGCEMFEFVIQHSVTSSNSSQIAQLAKHEKIFQTMFFCFPQFLKNKIVKDLFLYLICCKDEKEHAELLAIYEELLAISSIYFELEHLELIYVQRSHNPSLLIKTCDSTKRLSTTNSSLIYYLKTIFGNKKSFEHNAFAAVKNAPSRADSFVKSAIESNLVCKKSFDAQHFLKSISEGCEIFAWSTATWKTLFVVQIAVKCVQILSQTNRLYPTTSAAFMQAYVESVSMETAANSTFLVDYFFESHLGKSHSESLQKLAETIPEIVLKCVCESNFERFFVFIVYKTSLSFGILLDFCGVNALFFRHWIANKKCLLAEHAVILPADAYAELLEHVFCSHLAYEMRDLADFVEAQSNLYDWIANVSLAVLLTVCHRVTQRMHQFLLFIAKEKTPKCKLRTLLLKYVAKINTLAKSQQIAEELCQYIDEREWSVMQNFK